MAGAQGRIFISYRQQETASAARQLGATLVARYGSDRVVRNDDLATGADFGDRLRAAVRGSDAVLAVIGPQWATLQRDDDTDPVRIEIATALAAGIPVLPILVDGGKLPPPDALPTELAGLAAAEPVEIRQGFDLKTLFTAVDQALTRAPAPTPAAEPAAGSAVEPDTTPAPELELAPSDTEPVAVPEFAPSDIAAERDPLPEPSPIADPAAVAGHELTPPVPASAGFEPPTVTSTTSATEGLEATAGYTLPPPTAPAGGPPARAVADDAGAAAEPGGRNRLPLILGAVAVAAIVFLGAMFTVGPWGGSDEPSSQATDVTPTTTAAPAPQTTAPPVTTAAPQTTAAPATTEPATTQPATTTPASTGPPVPPPVDVTLTVAGPVTTSVECAAGRVLSIEATGEVRWGRAPDQTAAPDGAPGVFPEGNIVPDVPVGALIARVAEGPALFVGDTRTLVCPADGALELAVNTGDLTADTGAFEVHIVSLDGVTPEALGEVTLELPATQAFADSGFECAQGQRFRVSATGIAGAAGATGVEGGPDGRRVENGAQLDFEGFPHRALLGRVADGEAFLLGSSATVECPASGPLQLQTNDGELSDNTGAFVVTLSRLP